MKKLALAAVATLVVVTPALADETPTSNAMVYGGYNSPTNNYEDRAYVGFFYNQYLASGWGIHFDGSYVDREEDAALGVIGFSNDIDDGVRLKIAAGTSTENRSILPDLVARAGLEIKTGSTIVTPEYGFKRYRNGIEENLLAFGATHYFNIASDKDGYYAAQARVAHSMPNIFDDTTSFSLGISTVRNSGVSFGLAGEFGELSYSTIVEGAGPIIPGINSDYYAVRPSISIPVGRKVDLVARGEFSHNDFYETRGIMLGVQFKLD